MLRVFEAKHFNDDRRRGTLLACTLLASTMAMVWCPGNVATAGETLLTRAHAVVPHITGYDEKTDTFQYQNGALTYSPPRIGGPEGYGGNRLTQFRYTGSRQTAGLYRVLDDYFEAKKLDPKKYTYRLRW